MNRRDFLPQVPLLLAACQEMPLAPVTARYAQDRREILGFDGP